MFITRVFSFLALILGAFAFCVTAGPIVTPPSTHDLIVARGGGLGLGLEESSASALVARSGQCNSAGCNEKDVLDILIKLDIDLAVHIALLDGHHDPHGPCNDIAARIKMATTAILALDVNISGALGPLISQIVALLVKILSGIIGGYGRYGLLGGLLSGLLVEIVAILDVVLAGLVNACCHCCPGLLALLTQAIGAICSSSSSSSPSSWLSSIASTWSSRNGVMDALCNVFLGF